MRCGLGGVSGEVRGLDVRRGAIWVVGPRRVGARIGVRRPLEQLGCGVNVEDWLGRVYVARKARKFWDAAMLQLGRCQVRALVNI